jgi:hypothetical protein
MSTHTGEKMNYKFKTKPYAHLGIKRPMPILWKWVPVKLKY